MKVIYEAGLDQLIKHIKTALNGKEPTFSKNSGFNKTKTDAVENDTNKLFTAKGAYDLKNTITTAYTSLVNTTKSALETSINTKLSHGGYSGTAQSLKTDIDSKLPNPGFGGVHELGRYLDLHLSGSTADYDARIFVGSDKTVSMTNSNGTFEFGPKNTTHCHLYTDRASFYFNKELMINGNRAYHLGFKPTKDDVGLGNVTNIASSSSIDSNSTTTNATTSSIWRLRQMKASEYKDITVGGDANTYYPVVINVNGGCHDFWRFSVSRGYSWPAPNTWNNSTHKGGLTLSMMWSGDGGWGGNDHSLRVVQFNETYTTMVARLDLLKVGVVVWLRGGGAQYRINSDTGSNTTAVVHLGNLEDSDGAIYTPLTAINSNSIMNKFPIRNDGALYVNNNRVYHEGYKPTKTDVGLSNVDNIADSSKNVLSATRFTTARTINGTNFDGTGNITTANWGTARNLQIGNTAKSVNGSGNVTWSLAEIGAVNKAGDTMSAALKFTSASAPSVASEPTQLGYGCLSAYGTLRILGNTDNSSIDEPVIIASGKGMTSNAADGLSVGPNYLRFLGNNVYHAGNKPSKADVGLGSVNNWGASSSISANSTVEYATTNMVAQVRSEKLNNPGYGGVHELGRYLDLHLSGSTADYDARIWTDGGQKVCMSGALAVTGKTIVDASRFGTGTAQTPTVSLAIGDSDTGFHWESDGSISYWANNTRKYYMNNVWHSGNFDPGSKLNTTNPTVSGELKVQANIRFTNGTGMYVHNNMGTDGGSIGFLTSSGSWACRINNAGYVYANRVYNAVWNDYAEYFPKSKKCTTEAGDIIALTLDEDNELYELATEDHIVIVGAHSDCYGHIIGGEDLPKDSKETFEEYNNKKYIPVGLVGRLPVKFIGDAKKGMKVVPSHIPGVGRAFDRTKDDYDKVIGYIVENNNEEGIRRVKIKIGK